MPSIEEFMISVLFDRTDFLAGQKEVTDAADKTADGLAKAATKGEKAQTDAHKRTSAGAALMSKSVAEGNKKIADSFEGVLRTGLAFLAMFAGARSLEEFTRKVLTLDAAIGRMSHNVGSTPENVSALALAVQRTGGTFEGATSAVQSLSDAYQEFRTTGTTGILEPLSRLQSLGGKPITLGNDWHKTFLQISDDLKALDKIDPQQADFLGRQVLHDPATVNLAKGGSQAVLEAEAQSRRHGVITKEQAAAAERAQAAWADLNQSVTGFGNTLVTTLEPDVEQILGKMDDWIDKNKDWVAADIKGEVEKFTKFLQDHQTDIEHFADKIGGLISSAASLAVAFGSQSTEAIAFEAFIALLLRVSGGIGGVSTALTLLAAVPAPAWLLAITGASGAMTWNAAKRSATDLSDPKSVDDPHIGIDPETGLTFHAQDPDPQPKDAKPQTGGGIWGWIKRLYGFGGPSGTDDTKVKDNIADTATATKKLVEIATRNDGSGGGIPVTSSSGGLGGSGHHVRGGDSPGASLGDHAAPARAFGSPQQKANARIITEELRKAGLPDEGIAATLSSMQTESSLNPTVPENSYNHGHHGLIQWDNRRWPKVAAWIKSQGGDPWDTRWQARAFVAEGRAKPGDPLYDNKDTEQGFRDLEQSRGDVDRAIRGMRGIERFGRGEEGGRAALARKILPGLAVAPTAMAPVPAGTPGKTISDAEAFAAHQRLVNGGQNPKDRATYDEYLRQQNAPKPAPQSRLDRPFSGTAWNGMPASHLQHVAALFDNARRANVSTTHQSIDNSSEMTIRELHVHSRADDATGIARDTHAALLEKRARGAKNDYGLA